MGQSELLATELAKEVAGSREFWLCLTRWTAFAAVLIDKGLPADLPRAERRQISGLWFWISPPRSQNLRLHHSACTTPLALRLHHPKRATHVYL